MNAQRLAALDDLLERAPTPADVTAHRLGPLAAARLRATGRPVPEAHARAAFEAGVAAIAVRPLLERVRGLVEGPLLLIKGPEVAAHYADVALRGFKDLDLLTPDAARAQQALLAAGFVEVGVEDLYVDIHHLRPLWWPGVPLTIELHTRPKWVEGLPEPPVAELFAAAVPSRTGVPGIEALPAPHHALVLAAHSWEHEPLRRLRDLADIAMVIEGVDRREIEDLAAHWHVERLWRTTASALDALFGEGPVTWPLRVWARNLVGVRGRTVLESHLERWLSGFSIHPPRAALVSMASSMARDARPLEGESWRRKLRRTRRAVRNAFVRRDEHRTGLAEDRLE